jgi:hypothetical protein
MAPRDDNGGQAKTLVNDRIPALKTAYDKVDWKPGNTAMRVVITVNAEASGPDDVANVIAPVIGRGDLGSAEA